MRDPQKDQAMRQLANQALGAMSKGEWDTAVNLSSNVVDTYFADPDFDISDLDVTDALLTIFEKRRELGRALEIVRKQGEIQDLPPYREGLRYFRGVYGSNTRARISDFAPGVSDSQLGKTILIACIPKTGSTFLMNVLAQVTGFPAPKLCLSYANEENIMNPETILSFFGADKIAQEHIRATPQNLAIAQGFNMTVIVLVRDIFDSLISMRDMLMTKTYGSVAALFQNDLANFDEETQLDAVISKFGHWQLDFYTSWTRAIRDGRIDAKIISYETLMADKAASVAAVCRYAGLPIAEDAISRSINAIEGDKDKSRRNVGIAGRGKATMTAEQINTVRSMTRFYPDVDFSLLGL